MRTLKLTALAILAATAAHAGFRDPTPTSGERSADLNLAPRRAPSLAPSEATGRAPASPMKAIYGPQAPALSAPGKHSLQGRPSPIAAPAPGPVHRAPSLPGRLSIEIPGLALPDGHTVTVRRDSAGVIMAPKNRDQLHRFSREARMQLLPARAYPEHPRSVEIAARFAAALKPVQHRPIRTPLKLSISKIAKIQNPPSPIQYENMVKRLDALFDGFYLRHPVGISALFELSRSRGNSRDLQARDSLFAGILSRRAGWEAMAGNLLEESTLKRVDRQDRYLNILWAELEEFENISHVDRVVAGVNIERVKAVGPIGDQANYALARRMLKGEKTLAAASELEQRIGKPLLRERLELIRALSELRKKDKSDSRGRGIASLQRLEAEGAAELQGEARLALARAFLQDGKTTESLDHYRRLIKTGQNRLEVLGEQSYAEYRSGLFQDSLGKSMGLQSPYFQYGFAPDVHLVEIVSRKAMCDFGGAEAGIRRFEERYIKELSALQGMLAKKADPQAFYAELISYHGKSDPMRFQRFLLRLSAVMENQKVLNGARTELETIEQLGLRRHTQVRPKGWDEFAAGMHKAWAAKALALKGESARTALAEADYMVNRLRQVFAQVELISLDVATGASKNFNLHSALNFPVAKLAENDLEDEKFHWPFEDEIWEDELDFLKMKNPSKCAKVAQHAAAN